MNKLLYKFLVAIVSAPFISACNTENQTDAPLSIRDVTTIEITAPKADIAKSESVQLIANGITSGVAQTSIQLPSILKALQLVLKQVQRRLPLM